jgi:hypothetical protein
LLTLVGMLPLSKEKNNEREKILRVGKVLFPRKNPLKLPPLILNYSNWLVWDGDKMQIVPSSDFSTFFNKESHDEDPRYVCM